MAPQAKSTTKRRQSPKAKTAATRSRRPAPARKRATPARAKSGGSLTGPVPPKNRKAAKKRVDKLGDDVDQLAKIVQRLGETVKDMAADVAETRETLTKEKKKKKK